MPPRRKLKEEVISSRKPVVWPPSVNANADLSYVSERIRRKTRDLVVPPSNVLATNLRNEHGSSNHAEKQHFLVRTIRRLLMGEESQPSQVLHDVPQTTPLAPRCLTLLAFPHVFFFMSGSAAVSPRRLATAGQRNSNPRQHAEAGLPWGLVRVMCENTHLSG